MYLSYLMTMYMFPREAYYYIIEMIHSCLWKMLLKYWHIETRLSALSLSIKQISVILCLLRLPWYRAGRASQQLEYLINNHKYQSAFHRLADLGTLPQIGRTGVSKAGPFESFLLLRQLDRSGVKEHNSWCRKPREDRKSSLWYSQASFPTFADPRSYQSSLPSGHIRAMPKEAQTALRVRQNGKIEFRSSQRWHLPSFQPSTILDRFF